ncbi:DExH-box ATP-dependent RNA helicase DExH16, mitochondrial [Jatropha curcas]|uniref:DExH-box ATP-dependent RNA helicase DExH16, mitochondrial n=1 Tax=Jatropha curcas TaxID=180498 RepID=UPI0018931CD8|nr:DExH-box ATP-dependent RNA helicase DExH16, mitochondrial [Jatropha curcas]
MLREYSSGNATVKIDFTDLSCPHSWYPKAWRKHSKVYLHVGPTNSGIYCGPLRLLAWEVANRLNKINVPCDLIMGQEREEVEGAKHKAVTVEMADVNSDHSCAVVDEIQGH